MEMAIILVFIKLSIMSAFGRKIQENEGRGGRGVAFFFSFELHYCLTFHMPLYYLKKKIKLWKSICCLYHSIHAYLVNVTEPNIQWGQVCQPHKPKTLLHQRDHREDLPWWAAGWSCPSHISTELRWEPCPAFHGLLM